MNILLISTNRCVHPVPVMPLGLCMVAEACERAGHRVRVLDLMFEKDPFASIGSAVVEHRPDAVGLSVRNIDNNDMADPVSYLVDLPLIVNAVRRLTGAPVILGGAALGVMPEAILRLADVSCGVTGDGEAIVPRLLGRIEAGESLGGLPGLALLDQERFSLTPCASQGAPVSGAPDFHRWVHVGAYRSHLATFPVQTKLGCAFSCVYCTYRKLEGSGYRLAEPAAVAEAVTRLVVSGARDIEFVDSVFNAPREHAVAVCEALARTDHRARLQSLELNPAFFDDGLVSAMERAGFVGMGITAESASDPVLQGLGKGFTADRVRAAAEVVRRHRIPCAWIFLLGGPGETRESVRETLRFAAGAVRRQDVAFFNVGIRIYPGTELETIARREGVLSVPPADMLRPVFYVAPGLDGAWISQEVQKAMAGTMNFISAGSIGLSFLPTIHRVSALLGVHPPLWKHTGLIRRGLRMLGMEV